MFTNEYLKRVYADVERRDGHEPEFLQAVREVLRSLELVIDKHPRVGKRPGLSSALSSLSALLSSASPGWTIRA